MLHNLDPKPYRHSPRPSLRVFILKELNTAEGEVWLRDYYHWSHGPEAEEVGRTDGHVVQQLFRANLVNILKPISMKILKYADPLSTGSRWDRKGFGYTRAIWQTKSCSRKSLLCQGLFFGY